MRRPGIVVVTYNSEEAIGACLEAAARTPAELLVVDNASTDGTVAQVRRWPQVQLILNRSNRGFASAVNQGLAALDCEAVLLLNPDAILQTGIDALAEAVSAPGVAAAAGKLVGQDGRPQSGFSLRRFPTAAALAFEALGLNRIWPGNPVNRRYRCLDIDLDRPAEVEQPAGAFLMIRKDVWSELGGLDENFYPLWFEEVDFLRRAHRRGYSTRYVPAAVARHRGGHSVEKLPVGCRELYWYGSLLRYTSKHFGPAGRAAVCAAVMAGSLWRMAVRAVQARSLAPIGIYARVIRLGGSYFLRGRVRSAGSFAAAGTTI